jgi:hypothetical protein
LPAFQRLAPFFERARTFRRDRAPVLLRSDQDPGFLEALARGSDPVREAAFGKAELRARLRIGEAGHAPCCARIAIGCIDRAARKHVGARQERRAARSLQHEDFGPAGVSRSRMTVAAGRGSVFAPVALVMRCGRRGPCRFAP